MLRDRLIQTGASVVHLPTVELVPLQPTLEGLG